MACLLITLNNANDSIYACLPAPYYIKYSNMLFSWQLVVQIEWPVTNWTSSVHVNYKCTWFLVGFLQLGHLNSKCTLEQQVASPKSSFSWNSTFSLNLVVHHVLTVKTKHAQNFGARTGLSSSARFCTCTVIHSLYFAFLLIKQFLLAMSNGPVG